MQIQRTVLLIAGMLLVTTATQRHVVCQSAIIPDGVQANSASYEVSREEVAAAQRARLFDKYGAISGNDERARLDNFAIELTRDPSAMAYIIVFGTRNKGTSDAQKRARNSVSYLRSDRDFSSQILTVTSCFKTRVEYQLWILPRGAAYPTKECRGKPKVN